MSDTGGDNSRLSMLDAHGHRKFIIPAEVRGRFARMKLKVQMVLLVIFLGLPWLEVGGNPAILLDLPRRQFFFFGLHLSAHDAPLIFLLVLAFIGALALVTALWGRVWCGWACPQTVFIERVYRQIEIWVEGNYLERRRMQQSPANLKMIFKRSLKWAIYFLVSAIIAHSFMAYWTGGRNLIHMMQAAPSENWTYFVWVFAITGILLFNFGWFREQFCLIVCPYGKLQSTLLDSHSVTVMYDEKRGEPRKASTVPKDKQGDCVACNRCVQVCPTGIDIRQGIQMECIGCTACMDACDEIMAKVNKPFGLIRYKALTENKIKWFRSRVLFYAAIMCGALLGLAIALVVHSSLRLEILRGKDTPYVMIEQEKEKWVQNHFLLRAENTGSEQMEVLVNLPSGIRLILPENPILLNPGAKRDIPLIVEMPFSQMQPLGKMEIPVSLTQKQDDRIKTVDKKIPFLGPYSR